MKITENITSLMETILSEQDAEERWFIIGTLRKGLHKMTWELGNEPVYKDRLAKAEAGEVVDAIRAYEFDFDSNGRLKLEYRD